MQEIRYNRPLIPFSTMYSDPSIRSDPCIQRHSKYYQVWPKTNMFAEEDGVSFAEMGRLRVESLVREMIKGLCLLT